MRPFAFFDRRVRGFRVVELGGAAVLLVLILVVYLAKTGAGGKREDIDRVQAQIDAEQSDIRLLRAEVATLEQPERLEALSARYLNLQPIPIKHEISADDLADVARTAADTPATASPATPPAGAAPTVGAPADVIVPLSPQTTSIKPAAGAKIQTASIKPRSAHAPATIDAAIEDAQSPADDASAPGGR